MPPLLKPWLPPALLPLLLLLLAAALGPAAATLRPPPSNATLPSGSRNSSGHAAAASQQSLPLPSIAIPIRPPLLPPVPAVRLGPGAAVDLVVERVELKFSLGSAAGGGPNGTALSFVTPRYLVPRGGCAERLQPPALVLDAVCFTFGLRVKNDLPFQGVISCPDVPGVSAPLFVNGPHDLEWTNIHTHGLKVDPGAVSLKSECEPGSPTAGFPPNATPSLSQYYCSANTSSEQFCEVRGLVMRGMLLLFGDNVLATGRPLVALPGTAAASSAAPPPHPHAYPGVKPGGAVLSYTYPLGAVVPGVGWYHPHQHGSVGIQTPTAAGPLVVPESWLPGGVSDLYEPAPAAAVAAAAASRPADATKDDGGKVDKGGKECADCDRLLQVLRSQPLESSTILQLNAVWFRKTTDGSPDDDTLPFLGAAPGGNNVSPLLYNVVPDANGNGTTTAVPRFSNPAGRDWALINGAFQPTVNIVEDTYTRWEILNTLTMKWLDLTIQEVQPDGNLRPADCELRSGQQPAAGGDGDAGSSRRRPVSDLILGPANRADVLVKCRKPGTYVLASGAGPFHTNYDACKATHCECFGDAPANGATARPANNLYGGLELDAAVLAVVEVSRRFPGVPPDPDFRDGVCRSRLERFAYLDYESFPQPPVPQCFSFMNEMNGGFCSINSQLFPTATAYVEQGTQQVWRLRDTTFHPFHLHETPVRLAKLPACATSVTNNWAEGDWLDSINLPVCQSGCPWLEAGSGGGLCGSPVNVCDEVEVQWLASMFNMPNMPGRPDVCDGFRPHPDAPPKCERRYSVFHCHILPHEDEGCIWPVEWFCPGDATAASPPPLGECPAFYPPCSPPEPVGQDVPAPETKAISEPDALSEKPAGLTESWTFQLQQHVSELVAVRGFSAASCWVLEGGGRSVLVASSPQPALSLARAATSKYSLGSIISDDTGEPSGVAQALSSKKPFFATVQPGCEHLADLPSDLKALYQQVLLARAPSLRLCGPGLVPAPTPAHPRNVQLAVLPLVSLDGSVGGVLVLAATGERLARAEYRQCRGSPATSMVEGYGKPPEPAEHAAQALMREAAEGVVTKFFGSQESRSRASQACALALALAAGGDHASAIRAAADGVRALVQSGLGASSLQATVTLGLVLSRGGGSSSSAAAGAPGSAPASGIALSGSVAGASGSAAAAAVQRSLGAAGAAGPQLQLYCTPAGKPPVLMPLVDTLLLRPDGQPMPAPATTQPAAAPPSAPGPGPISAKRQVVWTTGVVGASSAAGGEALPADLAALSAAGVRAEREGAMVVASCPLPNILCAVVAYASVAPAQAARQPTAAELACVLNHLESATELLAACMEQRLLTSCGPALAAPGVRGALAAAAAAAGGSNSVGTGRPLSVLDVAGDPSGQLTLSMACAEDDESGAWGSASGTIVSCESLPVSTQGPGSALITGSSSKTAAATSAITPPGTSCPAIPGANGKRATQRALHSCANGVDPTAASTPGGGAGPSILSATSHTGSTTASACASACLSFGISPHHTSNSTTTSTTATALMTGSSNAALALATFGSMGAAGGCADSSAGGSGVACPVPAAYASPPGVVLAKQHAAAGAAAAAAAAATAAASPAAASSAGAVTRTMDAPASGPPAETASAEAAYCSGSLRLSAALPPTPPASMQSLLPSFASAVAEAATVTATATALSGNTAGCCGAGGGNAGDDKDDDEIMETAHSFELCTADNDDAGADGAVLGDASTGNGTSEYDVRPRSLDVPAPLLHRLQSTGAATAPPVVGAPDIGGGGSSGGSGSGRVLIAAGKYEGGGSARGNSGSAMKRFTSDCTGKLQPAAALAAGPSSGRLQAFSGGGGGAAGSQSAGAPGDVPMSAPTRLTASGASVVLTRTPPASLYRSPAAAAAAAAGSGLVVPPSGGSLGALDAVAPPQPSQGSGGGMQLGRTPLVSAAAAAAMAMMAEASAAQYGSAGQPWAASAPAGMARPPLGPSDPAPPPSQLRLAGGSVGGGAMLGSSAGGSGGGSGHLGPACVRCRSKDWSDQATEDPVDSHPTSGMRPIGGDYSGGSSGLRGAAAGRPVKVLSLDKAAMQLPRAQVPIMAPPPPPPPPPSTSSPTPTGADHRDTASAGGAVGAATAAAAAAAPQVNTRYAPRRLNRMYLPGAGAGGAAGATMTVGAASSAVGSGTCAGSVGSGVVTGASESRWTLQSQSQASTRYYEHAPGEDVAKGGLSSWARLPGTLPGTAAGMVHHPPHLQGAEEQHTAAMAAAFVAPAADAQQPQPQPQPGVVVPVAVPPARVYLPSAMQSALSPAPPQPAAAASLPAAASPTLLLPTQLPRAYTPFSKTAAGAAAAAAAAAAAHAAATSSAAAAAAAKGRQLADYAIPEDAPLEYTVSETVAMMRVLSRARGVHLSARMRRVRVTAKIQSAHPDTLPADLPSHLAKAAAAAAGGGGGGAGGVAVAAPSAAAMAAPGTWVLTGVAARRGCVELVFDMVQVLPPSPPRSPGVGRSGRFGRRPPSGPNGYVSYSAAQAAAASSRAGVGSSHGYRRWQGAAADTQADALFSPLVIGPGSGVDAAAAAAWQQLDLVMHGPVAPSIADAADAAAAATGGPRPSDERAWLGLRPEAVGAALQQCGLLDSATDPYVDVQVGMDPAGAVRLAWDAAANEWTAAAPQPPPAGDGAGAPPPTEVPTLWLPAPVVVCGRGATALNGVRVLLCSSAADGQAAAGSVPDDYELTARAAAGFLPVRVGAAGLRAPGGCGGAAVPLHPDDAAGDLGGALAAAAGGECRLQLLEIGLAGAGGGAGAGAALPACGGLLLVECRRGLVTSAPVPLLVLPEQEAAAAAELAGLRGAMAGLLYGSEGAARAAPTPEARAEVAASVEMAAQQFLTDLGTLLDAAAGAGVGGAASSTAGAGAGPTAAAAMDSMGLCSFNEDMRRLMAVRPEAAAGGASNYSSAANAAPLSIDGTGSAAHSPAATSTGSSSSASAAAFAAAAAAGTTPFGEHLVDLACTLLAGATAAGMLSTAALVLRSACVELGLAAPEVLLAEAGAGPRITVELLTSFVVASRARSSLEITRAAAAAAAAAACSTSPSIGSVVGAAAPAEAVVNVTSHAAAAAAEPAEWSTATATEAPGGGGDGASLSLSLSLGGGLPPGRSSNIRGFADMVHAGDETPTLPAGPSTGATATGLVVMESGRAGHDAAAANGPQPKVVTVAARAVGAVGGAAAGFGQTSDLPTWDSLASLSGVATGVATGSGVGDGNAAAGSGRTSMSLATPRRTSGSLSSVPTLGAAAATAAAAAVGMPGRTSVDSAVRAAPAAATSSVLSAAAAAAAASVMAAIHTDADSAAVAATAGADMYDEEDVEDEEAAAAAAGPSTSSSQPGSARSSNTGGRARLVPAAELLSAAAAGKGQESALAAALLQQADAQAAGAAAGGRSNSDCGGGGAAGAPAGGNAGPLVAAGGAAAGAVAGAGSVAAAAVASPWALRFRDPAMEAEYWSFVADRTSGMMWIYSLLVGFITVISCTRAIVEDGLAGFVSFAFFTGSQAAVWAWYCLRHGCRDPRALVVASLACKALRIASDLLWVNSVLIVPSLMGPMATRGIEVFAEAFMRPIAERVPMHLFMLMLALEMPCVWCLYRHFHSIFPDYWLRDHSLLRTLIFDAASVCVMTLAELYWRREFRRWRRSDGAAASTRHSAAAAAGRGSHGAASVAGELLTGSVAGNTAAVGKSKEE
ncbi:hypothetical protein HYH02_000820 [Chlamydomonas schloesseri]|uniref:Uncharacterized protein n=1 Tax=Chlamydomonas schloesseri TaxID=2026947 RepID=A0A835WZA1_9CHLO|nr:hypothetical protein HYH02_000820 [Chlamydomonas schloesseri]|eukprot:KAG2454995.1 hypothetical protein HYH02_000820 [Chlamydomonas schloesseri]